MFIQFKDHETHRIQWEAGKSRRAIRKLGYAGMIVATHCFIALCADQNGKYRGWF